MRLLQAITYRLKFVKYKITAKHTGGHGIHSPFIYSLLTEVIESGNEYYAYNEIAEARTSLLQSKEILTVEDLGSGSQLLNATKRTVGEIARCSGTNQKFGELLFRLLNRFRAKNIIELGTSVGIGTMYLSRADSRATIYTIEGCKQTAKVAKKNFADNNIKNVVQFIGDINTTLPSILAKAKTVDLVFFDGNHKKKPTIAYFELCLPHIHNDTVFIFDDIHWSAGMEEAWLHIVKHPKVTASIDLFFRGIVFFRKEMKQQNFVIAF